MHVALGLTLKGFNYFQGLSHQLVFGLGGSGSFSGAEVGGSIPFTQPPNPPPRGSDPLFALRSVLSAWPSMTELPSDRHDVVGFKIEYNILICM